MWATLLEQARDRVRKNKPVFVPAKHPKATVYRDVYGIPHIWADSEAAAAYAMAIAQCEDVGMTVFNSLRVGIARQAEVFGEKSVASDRNMLLWRVPENAEKAWRESPPRSKRYVQAFCDGLNDYRLAHSEECKNALPVEPPQILALIRMTDVPPSIGIVNADVARALNTPSPLPEFPHQSSTWVIGASRTASKKPIVFIDPHWPTSGNTSWWEFHLHAGRMQVGGFATPGMPVAGLGYTDGVAWGATAGGADSADAFELRINPENSNQYWFDGKWNDMLQRTVTIRVKNDSGDIETRTLSLRESVHGPIVREHDGRVFAGAICGVNDTRKLEQWLEMNRSKTTPEFRDAIRLDQAAWLNLTYASQDGHIGYVQTGMCPLRASEGYTWLGAHDGTRTAAFWQGRVDFDKLPQVHDPESDWLQSCNTSASYVTAGRSLSIQDFPPGVLYAHFPYDGAPVWRGRGLRCFDVLPSTRDVTHRWAKAFAFDTFAPAGPIWAPALVKAYEQYGGETPDRDLSMKMLVQALRQWDYQVDKESIGATAFRYWRSEYVKLHPDAVGENTAHGFPKSEQQQRDAIKALASASQYLKENYGTALVPWGRILRLRRGELDLPLDGDTSFAKGTECLRATGTLADDGEGHFVFQGGQVIPTVVELTDPVRVSSVVPFGQSRRPSSPHYTDQAHLFSEGRMRPAWHSWSQLHNHVKSQRVTEYKGGSP